MFILKSGTSGNTAEVDSNNRLNTFATSQSSSTFASCIGDLFNVNTGAINLTSSSPSALLHMRNTDTVAWIFTRIFYNAEVSIGGSGEWLAEIIANATQGTLISGGSPLTPYNLNFGSAKTLSGTTLKGDEGDTLTDGQVRISTLIPASGTRVLIPFDSVVVPPGATISIRITPQAGNTSMNLQVGFNMYREDRVL